MSSRNSGRFSRYTRERRKTIKATGGRPGDGEKTWSRYSRLNEIPPVLITGFTGIMQVSQTNCGFAILSGEKKVIHGYNL